MDAQDLHELTAAYALDALGADEAEAYEAHLAHCARCRDELAQLSEPAAALAWAGGPATPPPALRARILDAAARERTKVVPLRRAWLLRTTAAVAAVAACTAVGLGIWAGSLLDSVHRERSARAADARAVEILADPASRRIHLAGADGMVAVDPTGQGALMLKRLPPAPAGKTYEAWVIVDGKARSAGIFAAGSKTVVVHLRRPVPSGAIVAVTIERAGGSVQPTTQPFITSAQV